jgi:hypothetical protein
LLTLLAVALLAQASTPAQAGPIGVVLSTRRAGADALGKQVAQMVRAALEANALGPVEDDAALAKQFKSAGAPDPRSCSGARLCLTGLASRLGSAAVIIGIDAGKVMKTVAVHLEAVSADGTALAQADFSAPGNRWADDASPVIARFARELKDALIAPTQVAAVDPTAPPAEPVKTDRPVADPATPPSKTTPVARTTAPPMVAAPPPARTKSYVLPAVLGGVAVAAGGVGTYFGLQSRASVALADGAQYQFNTRTYLTDAQTSATAANVLFAVAGTAVIGAAVSFFWPAAPAAAESAP